jgi:8-oxo-dGTP pyrophosphatase MutT (NUDIX family)
VSPLIEQIRDALAQATPRSRPLSGMTPAAVLLPLFHDPEGVVRLAFTLRTDTVRHHRNQISFPGGVVDRDDTDSVDTALRETHEEVGVPGRQVELLGRLSDYPTITSYRITPHVGFIRGLPRFEPAPDEVAEVFSVPIQAFLNGDIPEQQDEWEADGRRVTMYAYDHQGHHIWGATAAILHELLQVIRESRSHP